ncbi:MAG TPA: serine/threonine-protein kinase, partial [Polyangia bacterium]
MSRIGGGPSGEVWQASDAQTGGAVAYKAVAPGSLPTQIIMDRAMRELRQLQRTSSPRIVKVVDFGKSDDGSMYVASELASGEPLDQLVARSGPFPLDRAKRIVAQIGEALLDAQKVGVVHRDLSAKNVLVSGDDEVRIINFAIARPFSDTVCGVPEFMSPEQADGKLIDQRSNTYSLGALIYFMLTGQPPFVGASPQATVEAIHKGELIPPSIKRSGGGLTAEVDRVVLKALERSSSRRPLTLRQFLADVAALVVSEQTATTVSTASGKEPAFVKTMMFAGGSQEVQKLVAQAVAARDAAAGGSPSGQGGVFPNPTTVGMGPPPPRLPTPVPLTGGRPAGAGLPSGTPGPTRKEGAPRPSHGAAVSQTMIAMPAAGGAAPVPGSSGSAGGVAST